LFISYGPANIKKLVVWKFVDHTHQRHGSLQRYVYVTRGIACLLCDS